jgi:hypothetical protein
MIPNVHLRSSELLGVWTFSIVPYSRKYKTRRFGNWICFHQVGGGRHLLRCVTVQTCVVLHGRYGPLESFRKGDCSIGETDLLACEPCIGSLLMVFGAPPPDAGPADHNPWCSFIRVYLLAWWGLSCDLFSLPSPPFVLSCDTLNYASLSLPVWLSSATDVWSAHQNSVWINFILNCCFDISVAAGMEPSRKPCCGIEN